MRQQRTFRILILLIALFALGLVLLPTLQNIFFFRVTSVSPNPKKFSSATPFIDITYSKALASKQATNFVADNTIVDKFEVHEKQLRLYLHTLEENKTYTITLRNVASLSGKTIASYSFSFKPRSIDFQDLPSDQQRNILTAQQQKKAEVSDPILEFLPHGDLAYTLTAISSGSAKPTLQAEITLSSSDEKSGRDAAIAGYQKMVRDYISSVGLNPDTYTIDYVIIDAPF